MQLNRPPPEYQTGDGGKTTTFGVTELLALFLELQIGSCFLLPAHLADAVLQPGHVRQDDLHAQEKQRTLQAGGHPKHHEEDKEPQRGE